MSVVVFIFAGVFALAISFVVWKCLLFLLRIGAVLLALTVSVQFSNLAVIYFQHPDGEELASERLLSSATQLRELYTRYAPRDLKADEEDSWWQIYAKR